MGSGGMGGGIFSVGKSKAKMYEKGNAIGITFKDVAGQEGAKQEVKEIVDFLKNPQKYTDLGGKIPKGALLVGPPGTGKTLLVKAVAGEAGVPFFSMSGSDFVEMFVGVGASRVRDLFRQAKEKSPCIIFIDEIDAVGRARSKNPAMGGNDERENTLNALLTEMDGFGTNSGVIILAATNRVDMLDSALLRAGRFDREIHVDLPGLNERKAIFLVHLKPIKIDETVDVDLLARQTPGFSGADIANVCNEAALIAARHDKKAVCKQDFLDAVDRIVGGLEKKTKVMTADEKRSIALHEAGHATISWFCQYANPLIKVTIVPRGQALGAAWYLPEERQITTKEQMLDEMCSLMGGRAAEELFTGHISSGAMNDLERATKSAYGMVACFLNPRAMVILFALITGLSIWEYCGLVNQKENVTVNRFISTVAGVYFFLAVAGFRMGIVGNFVVFVPYLLTILYLFISELYTGNKDAINDWAYTMLSQLYIALPFSMINVLSFETSAFDGQIHYDMLLPLSIFIFLWTNDTGAYCSGSLFGKHKLFPRISPAKSWEGSIGGGIFVLIAAGIIGYIANDGEAHRLSILGWEGLGLVVVFFGTWGDLVESLFKRTLGVKDSGNILPGHGGMLDRFDSSLMAIPAAVIYLYTIQLFG